MHFELEEWVGESNPYRTYPIFTRRLATREEAEKERRLHEPQHGGFIEIIGKPDEGDVAKPKRKRAVSRRRMAPRDGGRP